MVNLQPINYLNALITLSTLIKLMKAVLFSECWTWVFMMTPQKMPTLECLPGTVTQQIEGDRALIQKHFRRDSVHCNIHKHFIS